MSITATVRQARLRPERAEGYPTLPARMWTSATCLAELVASYRRAGPMWDGTTTDERILSEADFEFRGGTDSPPALHQLLETREGHFAL